MSKLVFVYGTLKRGQRNHQVMEGARYVRDAVTSEAAFTLIEANSVSAPGRVTPSVGENGNHHISGELYEVGQELLQRLDEFEDVGVHYQRKTVTLEDGQTAEMYLHMPSSSKQPRAEALHISQQNQIISWAEPA